MRLLNAKSEIVQVMEFEGDEVPPYAILSHTWGKDEVSFRDIQDPVSFRSREGYKKIKYSCDQAVKDGLEWVWVDTCCIDKASSAELSEAINSMFLWYQNARVCYAYLVDVTSHGDPRAEQSAFTRSRWWTRGRFSKHLLLS